MTTFASHFAKITGLRSARTAFLIACAGLLAAAPGSPLLREVRADPTPAASASPAAAVPIDAVDLDKLRLHVGEQVTIRGTPNASGHSKSGNVAYLNFAAAHKAVSLVFFLKPGQTGALTSEDDLKQFIGKTIVVTGKLTDYKSDLQIAVESPDQIKAAP